MWSSTCILKWFFLAKALSQYLRLYVCILSSVNQHMYFKMLFPCKSLATMTTSIRFLPSVIIYMYYKLSIILKIFITMVALQWPFPCACCHWYFKYQFLKKGLTTITLVWIFPSVNHYMYFKLFNTSTFHKGLPDWEKNPNGVLPVCTLTYIASGFRYI